MKKAALVLAMVLGLNVVGWTVSSITKVGYAQESPTPEEPKPEKPSE